MKRLLTIFSVCIIFWGISGCGTIFGGHISDCQKHAYLPGQSKRKIRPAALVFDILPLPLAPILLPIDFISGGVYKPCSLIREVQDSLDSTKERHRERTNARGKFLTIFNDPLQGVFCEDLNIGIEHPITRNFTVALDFGTVHPTGIFYVNPISPAQRDWPGTVYYGYDTKVELKFFNNKKPSTYLGINVEYKHLWYNNVPFVDQAGYNGDTDPIIATYTRDERTDVFGIDIIGGHERAYFNRALMVDYFFGIGFRYKFRSINTYASQEYINQVGEYPQPYDDYTTNGNSKANLLLPTPIFGIKIGLNTFKKKQDKFGLSVGQADSQ